MFKGFLIATLVVLGVVLLDQHYAYGRYTDGTLAMLSEIKRSFRL